MFQLLKQILPRSLYGRSLMILIIPVLLVLVISTYIFYDRHWDTVRRHMASSLAGDIAFLINQVAAAPEDWFPVVVQTAKLYMDIELTATLPHSEEPAPPEAYPVLADELSRRIDHPFTIARSEDEEDVIVHVYLPEQMLSFQASRKRLVSATTYIFVLWMSGTALLVISIAVLFLRNQIRPIAKLAEAAEHFGRGIDDHLEFKPQGASEVRRAGASFLTMRNRIRRQVSQRTDMLAAISHDLRTPLTRLKLQLAMLGHSHDIEAMTSDVQEMEKMIEEYLDFARGEGTEQSRKTDLKTLLEELVESFRRSDTNVSLTTGDPCTLTARPRALRRALANLIDNATRYGSRAELTLQLTDRFAMIHIDDDGPGIDPDKREEVLQAFTRLDSSRNLNRGGVGLGLAIARDIITGHGGTLQLGDSTLGGLRVTVTLPR